MNMILVLTLILIVAELFEAFVQRAENLKGILRNLYSYYQKNVFLFFLVQPGFYLLLCIILYTEVLNSTMIFLLALKIFDIFYKIELINQVFIKQQVSQDLVQMLEYKMPSGFYFLGVFTYPPMLFFALL